MYQAIIFIHVLLGLGVIGLVLMQQGKGADAGAAFGTGSAGSVFGAQGAASFLSRSTAILASLFFSTSLALAVINGHKDTGHDLMTTPVAEQNNSGLPSVQGAKTDIPPPVNVPAIPVATTPPAAAPTPTTTSEKTDSAVETPKTVGSKPSVDEAKPAVEAVKPTEEKKPVDVKKPVEHKPSANDKDKKAEAVHKGKDVKKDH